MKVPGLPWVSSGPEGPVVMPLCIQCRRYHFNAWSKSQYPAYHAAQENISNAGTSVTKVSELHGG